ncbi:MAG: biotin--[acetyl-CoA-carboxylase] ligase [Solirubrobacterales bacterium]|nr:biotin--[acetyl-CoA-carboxylase] ligase [Solirubrobacterales bacterium]
MSAPFERFGSPRLHLRTTGSTNELARALAEAGAPDGALVSCDLQSAGRGRSGRGWESPDGAALLASFVLRGVDRAPRLLALAVPLAVCEAIERCGGPQARVKWPNDVWIEGGKAAGILIEARPPEWAVLGIGVNVTGFPDQAGLRWPAAATGGSVEALLSALCPSLGRWCEASEDRIREAFSRRDALSGRRVGWEGARGGRGTAAGIDADGRLLVETDAGETTSLTAGEVSLQLGDTVAGALRPGARTPI